MYKKAAILVGKFGMVPEHKANRQICTVFLYTSMYAE